MRLSPLVRRRRQPLPEGRVARWRSDLVVQRPRGPVLPAGRFLHRPVAAGGARRHHACACRPRAPRPRPLPRRGAGRRRAAHPARARSTLQTLPYGEAIEHNGVRSRLHPAGHVLGSAQVRLEHGGQVWVASRRLQGRRRRADSREDNATCAPFEPVRCDCFITESTFGLPIYRWQPQAEAVRRRSTPGGGATPRPAAPACSSATASARRSASCSGVDRSIGPIIVHGAVEPLNRAYRAAGVALPETPLVTEVEDKADCSAAP